MKELIKRIIQATGYEIHHKSFFATTDPFRQQELLLRGVSAPMIFDVGANVGTTAQKYRRIFPGAEIHAFEPFPEAFAQLEGRVRGDGRIVPHRVALGSTQSKKVLRVNAASPTNSLLETADTAASFWGQGLLETTTTVEVEVGTIDEFCTKRRIARIDLLKIDTQGTELGVLQGAIRMLSEGEIHIIYTEMIVAPTYKGQPRPHELMGFLEDHGYTLSGLYDLWRRSDGRLLQMDAIFVRLPDVDGSVRQA